MLIRSVKGSGIVIGKGGCNCFFQHFADQISAIVIRKQRRIQHAVSDGGIVLDVSLGGMLSGVGHINRAVMLLNDQSHLTEVVYHGVNAGLGDVQPLGDVDTAYAAIG